jgi:hypothetical protein
MVGMWKVRTVKLQALSANVDVPAEWQQTGLSKIFDVQHVLAKAMQCFIGAQAWQHWCHARPVVAGA